MKDDPKFWEWLRNRGKETRREEQPMVELQLPLPPKERSTEEVGERGVCVIEIF